MDRAEFVTLGDELGPDLLHHAPRVPPLEPVVDGALGPELTGQLLPLAAGTHAEEDPVEGGTPIGDAAPGGLLGPEFPEDRLDPPPQVVGDLPDRGQRLAS